MAKLLKSKLYHGFRSKAGPRGQDAQNFKILLYMECYVGKSSHQTDFVFFFGIVFLVLSSMLHYYYSDKKHSMCTAGIR